MQAAPRLPSKPEPLRPAGHPPLRPGTLSHCPGPATLLDGLRSLLPPQPLHETPDGSWDVGLRRPLRAAPDPAGPSLPWPPRQLPSRPSGINTGNRISEEGEAGPPEKASPRPGRGRKYLSLRKQLPIVGPGHLGWPHGWEVGGWSGGNGVQGDGALAVWVEPWVGCAEGEVGGRPPAGQMEAVGCGGHGAGCHLIATPPGTGARGPAGRSAALHPPGGWYPPPA